MPRFLVAVTALIVAAPLRAAEPPQREPYEDAIDGGLVYLARTQAPDGSWATSAELDRSGDPALTGLAVMAFLSAGHVPGEGKYGAVVDRGVRFVMRSQRADGLIPQPGGNAVEMYAHGIGTLMLAEVVGMTDEKTAVELKERLARAVRVILRAQRTSGADAGGWRYRVRAEDEDPRTHPHADLSVTGWQILALRAARDVGCDVPEAPIRAAVEYVNRCFRPASPGQRAGYAYTVGGQVTPACTGTGVLVLELAGKTERRSLRALQAGAFLLHNPPDPSKEHFFYGAYYSAQAMFQLGDNYWQQHREVLHRLLLRDRGPRANGAWYGTGPADREYGPVYCTALAILALTVEYRYLPIYQRDEGDSRDEK